MDLDASRAKGNADVASSVSRQSRNIRQGDTGHAIAGEASQALFLRHHTSPYLVRHHTGNFPLSPNLLQDKVCQQEDTLLSGLWCRTWRTCSESRYHFRHSVHVGLTSLHTKAHVRLGQRERLACFTASTKTHGWPAADTEKCGTTGDAPGDIPAHQTASTAARSAPHPR